MNALTHPMVIHLSLGLIFILPVLVVYTIFLERKNSIRQNKVWLTITILSVVIGIFSALAVYTGEMGEEILEDFISEKHIASHEEFAEMFAIINYVLAASSILILVLRNKLRMIALYLFLGISLVSTAVAIKTGSSGGDLVYKYNGAKHLSDQVVKDKTQERKGTSDSEAQEEEDDDD